MNLLHIGERRPAIQALVFLYWIFSFTSVLTGSFIQIYIYERFSDLVFNLYIVLFFYTGIFFGFCVCGYVAGKYRLNIKLGFALSLALQSLSFAFLLFEVTKPLALLFIFLLGLGSGLFWLTIHTFELARTKDEERDNYVSMLSAGDQTFQVLGPALASLLIWVSFSILDWDNFTLLFSIVPFIYFVGFWFLRSLGEYRPEPLEWGDVSHFLQDGRNRILQVYFAGEGLQHLLAPLIFPLVAFTILGTALSVGLYSTIFGAVSVIGVIIIAKYRTTENRLFFLGIGTLLLCVALLWLGFTLSFVALVAFTITISLVTPLIRVSSHLISLQAIEKSARSNRDFYATMILRDFSLWFWRMVGGGVLLLLLWLWGAEENGLKIGLYLFAAALILCFGAAYAFLKKG